MTAPAASSLPTPQEALQRLVDGNRRYAETKPLHPHQTAKHRAHLVDGQHPIAAVLSCADSRVPSELIFDQGFGDLFVIRVAGNVADAVTVASIEFAVAALNVPLVMVMGHTSCGAVRAALNGSDLPGHLPGLVARIHPAVEQARDAGAAPQLDDVVRIHARLTARKLAEMSHVIAGGIAEGALLLAAATYNLESGLVEILA